MTREEVQQRMRTAHTLPECEQAQKALLDYLREHPDDLDLQEEGGGLYMKRIALENRTAQQKAAERVA